ncbi:MAG: HD domain-containing protein [Candidatus Nealsonbacteria bacterium]|nr:HD domain-containing protein [Candidatus Nealsonbacteria bacterium]
MAIPKEVKLVLQALKKAGFEAYIVGGCVRDLLRGVEPMDWDITTNAKPEEIQRLFEKSFYENQFLTVTVQTGSKSKRLNEIEVTAFRSEAKYSDKRHPDEVKYAKTLQEDLSRRDFTINAMALGWLTPGVNRIDPFGGQQDLKAKVIKTVGDPKERFNEDALRMLRAVRFAAVLGNDWRIEAKTAFAIKENAAWLQAISKERIRDELLKIMMSERAAEGIEFLRELGLLAYILPELIEGYNVAQNKHHIYSCYEHSVKSLEYAAKQGFSIYVRVAALLHDIAKPKVKRGDGPSATFYNHETVGAKMATTILDRLKFPKKDIERIAKLVRYHLFYYNVGEVTESSVRRLVRQVGPENMEELLQVRMADRIGSGVPKAEPYKLRHLKYIIDKVSQNPISMSQLNVTGHDVMSQLRIVPSPKIGQILDILLGKVLEDPKANKKEFLLREMKKLGKLSEEELSALSERAKKDRERLEMKRDEMTKQKYWVS